MLNKPPCRVGLAALFVTTMRRRPPGVHRRKGERRGKARSVCTVDPNSAVRSSEAPTPAARTSLEIIRLRGSSRTHKVVQCVTLSM